MEIEKRAFVDDLDVLRSKIETLGAKKIKTIHIVDYWLCRNECTKFEEVQQHAVGSYGLRVRKIILPERVEWEFNCKVLETEGDHNAFHEYETIVEDGDSVLNILSVVGFKVFCVLDKKREMYSLNNITINLENIVNFKSAIELEIIDDKDIAENKALLDRLLSDLEIKKENLIEKSITYLFMKEFSFK